MQGRPADGAGRGVPGVVRGEIVTKVPEAISPVKQLFTVMANAR